MSALPTIPGTETKVTPEMESPSIPMATIHQGLVRPARKNSALLERLRVSQVMKKRKRRYRTKVRRTPEIMIVCGVAAEARH